MQIMNLLKKLVIACVIIFSSLSVSSANSAQLKSIEIFNASSLQNDYFINMAKYAEEQMASLAANTIVIVYPIGRFLTGENPKNNSTSFRGASHEVVLTETQVNKINLRVSNFLQKASCLSAKDKKRISMDIDWWLRNGGASQLQDPICKKNRLVMISIDPDRKRDKRDLSRVFFHELYHSFQHDLNDNCRGPNDLWVIEAGAEYFAQHSIAAYGGKPENFINDLLKFVLWHARMLGTKLKDPGVAEKGLGALRLMIQKGWLDESRILNGSFFHKCARVEEFKNSNPHVQYIKKNWHKIEKVNGAYTFNLPK